MQRISLVKAAHNKIKEKLPKGGLAIDATVGNGHDTLFLAEQVGKDGVVYGFDIQQAALEKTRTKLEQAHSAECARLYHANHANLIDFISKNHQGFINAAMFNLGYLPGTDKTIITQAITTIKAIESSLSLLAPDGIMTIIAYPGHPGGLEEKEALADFCEGLDLDCFTLEVIESSVPTETAPRLYTITKLKITG